MKAASVNYDISSKNKFAHITNYTLQKHNKMFNKFETGNEISFEAFQVAFL